MKMEIEVPQKTIDDLNRLACGNGLTPGGVIECLIEGYFERTKRNAENNELDPK